MSDQASSEHRFTTAFGGSERVTRQNVIDIINRLNRDEITSLDDMRDSLAELSNLMNNIDRTAEPEIVRQFDALAKKIGDKVAARNRVNTK